MKKLYYGGEIITIEDTNENIEAILIEDGTIKKVGSLDTCKAFIQDDDTEMINLKGNTLMPGFIDPHSHFSAMGPVAEMCDLHACDNFEDIIQMLQEHEFEKGLDKDDIILGFGYDHNFLEEEEHPTKHVLNQVSAKKPVLILHASGHVGCANDAALKMGNINKHTPDKNGGRIGRENGTLEPNGYLEEGNLMALQNIIFSGVETDHFQLAIKGQEVYTSNGITTVQDGATGSDMLKLLKGLAEANRLKVDVVAYPTIADNPEDMADNKVYAKQYHNRLKINGYKLFLDGSPQGKTAWMTKPYEGEKSYRGYPWYRDEQVKQYVARAIHDDVQLLTHSNGDASSDQLLQNYEAALEESTNPNKHHLRPVMIHCQTVRDDQLDKMAELSMIPSIFVDHTYYWGDVHLKKLRK